MGSDPKETLEKFQNEIRKGIENMLNQREVQEFLGEFGRSEDYLEKIQYNLETFYNELLFIKGTLLAVLDQPKVKREIDYLRREISRIDDEIKRMKPRKPSLEEIFLGRLRKRSDIEEIWRSLKLYQFYNLDRGPILKMLRYHLLTQRNHKKRGKYEKNFENARKEISDELENYMRKVSKKEISKDLDLIKRFMEMDLETEENLRSLVKILKRNENILQAKNALSYEYSNSIKEFRKKIEEYNQKMKEFEKKSKNLLNIKEKYEKRLKEIMSHTGIFKMLRQLNKNNVLEEICNILSGTRNFIIKPVPWRMSVISYLAEKEGKIGELHGLVHSLSFLLLLEYIKHKVKESFGKKNIVVYEDLEKIINDFEEISIATSIIEVGESGETKPLATILGEVCHIIFINSIRDIFKSLKNFWIEKLGKNGEEVFNRILSFMNERKGKLISLKDHLSENIKKNIENLVKKTKKELKKEGTVAAEQYFITELFCRDFLYEEAQKLQRNILQDRAIGINELIVEYFGWKNEDIDFLHNILARVHPVIYFEYKKDKCKSLLDSLEAIVMYGKFFNKYREKEPEDVVKFFIRSNMALSSLHILFLSGIGNLFLEDIEELCQKIYSLKRSNTC